MGMEHRALVFGMKLCADKPFQVGNLHDFHQAGGWIKSRRFHAVGLEIGEETVVEFIAVAVTFAHQCLSVDGSHSRASLQLTVVGSQPHSSAHLGNTLLCFHQVDDILRSQGIDFRTVGLLHPEHMASKLYDHHLHTQTDAEAGHIVLTGILDSQNLTFYAPLSEARTDNESMLRFQQIPRG